MRIIEDKYIGENIKTSKQLYAIRTNNDAKKITKREKETKNKTNHIKKYSPKEKHLFAATTLPCKAA